jgi:hypothetical protein
MVYKEERFWVFVVVGCLRVSHFVMVHIDTFEHESKAFDLLPMKTK